MLALLKHHGKKPHKGRSGLPKFGKEKGSPYFHEYAFTPQIKIFYKIISPECLTLLPTVQVSLLLHHWTALSLCLFNKSLDIKFGSLLTFVLSPAPDHGLFPQWSKKHHSFLLLTPDHSLPAPWYSRIPAPSGLTKSSRTLREITLRLIGNGHSILSTQTRIEYTHRCLITSWYLAKM